MDTMTLQALPIRRTEISGAPDLHGQVVPRSVAIPGRAALLAAGIVIAGAGVAALIRAGLGTGPGDVMIGALAGQLEVSHGVAAQAVAIAFVVVAVVLGRRPGPGTIATALLLGPVVDVAMLVVVTPGSMPLRVLQSLAGFIAMGIGVGIVIGARFGPSTGELWADAVSAHLRMDKQHVRWWLEATLLTVGMVLGGPAGAMTLLIALFIGPLVDLGRQAAGHITGVTAEQWSRSTRRFSRL